MQPNGIGNHVYLALALAILAAFMSERQTGVDARFLVMLAAMPDLTTAAGAIGLDPNQVSPPP